MKILVYGAGVIGSLIAAWLKESGQDVSLLARGQRLADLREHGIVLENIQTEDRYTTRVNLVEQLAPEDAYDLVVVAVRMDQVESVLPALAANHHTPNVLFIGNNPKGPDPIVQALGRDRVLMGFLNGGGMREGYTVRFMLNGFGKNKGSLTFGELNGEITPRLDQIATVFHDAGFPVEISKNIVAWLKTHAVLTGTVASAIYLAGGDNYRLAHTPDGLVLLVRSIKESLDVLRTLGVPITPPAMSMLGWIPEPVLIPVLQRVFDTQFAEEGLVAHAREARDEMREIAAQFQEMARLAGTPTPAMDELFAYADPAVQPMPEGTANIGLEWRGLVLGIGMIAGLVLALGMLRPKRRWA